MMKITKKHLLLSVIAIIVIFFVIKNDFFNLRGDKINTIVVRAYDDNCSTHFHKKNHVLMITDPIKILQYSALLLYNPQETDPCGDYAYNIQFWTDNGLYEEVETDEDGSYFLFFPDSVKSLLDEVGQQYHFDPEQGFNEYLLKIPVNYEPTELIEKLKKNNIKSFIPEDLNWHYPYLKIQSTYEGEKNKQADRIAIEKAETRLSDFLASSNIVFIHKNEFEIGDSFLFEKRVKIKVSNFLYFPFDTDLSTITPQLIQAGFSILEQNNPDYYYLTLVDKRDAHEIEKFIQPFCQGCLVLIGYDK